MPQRLTELFPGLPVGGDVIQTAVTEIMALRYEVEQLRQMYAFTSGVDHGKPERDERRKEIKLIRFVARELQGEFTPDAEIQNLARGILHVMKVDSISKQAISALGAAVPNVPDAASAEEIIMAAVRELELRAKIVKALDASHQEDQRKLFDKGIHCHTLETELQSLKGERANAATARDGGPRTVHINLADLANAVAGVIMQFQQAGVGPSGLDKTALTMLTTLLASVYPDAAAEALDAILDDGEPYCCVIGCEEPADFEIRDGDGPDDFTHACTGHVGELCSDGVCQVYPIDRDPVEQEALKEGVTGIKHCAGGCGAITAAESSEDTCPGCSTRSVIGQARPADQIKELRWQVAMLNGQLDEVRKRNRELVKLTEVSDGPKWPDIVDLAASVIAQIDDAERQGYGWKDHAEKALIALRDRLDNAFPKPKLVETTTLDPEREGVLDRWWDLFQKERKNLPEGELFKRYLRMARTAGVEGGKKEISGVEPTVGNLARRLGDKIHSLDNAGIGLAAEAGAAVRALREFLNKRVPAIEPLKDPAEISRFIPIRSLVQVKVRKLNGQARIPEYDYPSDAGAGVFAAHGGSIPPGGRMYFATGIALELPDGYKAVGHSRSGMWREHGVHLEAMLIDNGYRGEIGVVLKNSGTKFYHVQQGDKIAQLCIERFQQATFEEAAFLTPGDRGDAGWGSTGR